MTPKNYTISQDGRHVFSTPITQQAINGAKAYAARSGKDVSAVRHYYDAPDREITYHPDGTHTKLF